MAYSGVLQLNRFLFAKRKRYEMLMQTLMKPSVGMAASLVLFLLFYVLINGIPQHHVEAAQHHPTQSLQSSATI